MDFLALIFSFLWALLFTRIAIQDTFAETRRICRIFAFVWWLVFVVKIVQMILF